MEQQSDLIISEDLIARLLQPGEIANPFAVARHRQTVRAAVIGAVASGILQRPSECSDCGSPGTIEGHHDDYDKPLEVRWLCKPCHSIADRARRLRDVHRPSSDNLAAFLFVTGGVELPFSYDPPHDEATNGDLIDRAIRAVKFAGFDPKARPWVAALLSCGHEELLYASELVSLRTYAICHSCTESERSARRRRAERRRERRRERRARL